MEKCLIKAEYLNKNWEGGIFNGLSTQLKEQIKKEAVLGRFKESESIEMCDFFGGHRIWMVVSGELHLVMRDEEGKTIVLMKYTAGNIGFMLPVKCLNSLTYSIEVICSCATELCYIPEKLSFRIYQECDSLKEIQKKNSEQLYLKLFDLINDLAFSSLKDRLKKCLNEYCILQQTDTIEITHGMLAEELATSREVISRALKRLEEENLIRNRRKSIQILDFKASDKENKKGIRMEKRN